MGDAALSNLGGVGALPGLDLQFVMELLAGLFLASLRIGAFLISSPFFGGSYGAAASSHHHGGASWRCRGE